MFVGMQKERLAVSSHLDCTRGGSYILTNTFTHFQFLCASSRRKEEDRKHIHENVDAKIKSWATGLCQSDVLVNDCVIVTHDYSPGRRIETGAAVVKRITYCPKFGYAFFSVKYAVGNRMIAVRDCWNRNMKAHSFAIK